MSSAFRWNQIMAFRSDGTPLRFGQRVKATEEARRTFPRLGTMIGKVVGGKRLASGSVRVHRDGIIHPDTWAADYWVPARGKR